MSPAVLFDLGNTLAAYYRPERFEPILEEAIGNVVSELRALALSKVDPETAFAAAKTENSEAADHRFTPMADRLERIFRVSLADNDELSRRVCRRFLEPIFAISRVYDDALPALERLRRMGVPTGIVSNMPWGSPPVLWRSELERLVGLAPAVDSIVLCGDVGWRKPAALIFRFAADAIGREPEDCIFVGDALRWDIAGSAAVGMRPVLIDRDRRNSGYAGERIKTLEELSKLVEMGA